MVYPVRALDGIGAGLGIVTRLRSSACSGTGRFNVGLAAVMTIRACRRLAQQMSGRIWSPGGGYGLSRNVHGAIAVRRGDPLRALAPRDRPADALEATGT